jgi:ABC-type branched-subunit amino acid transport system substrate-binding protein
VVEGFRMAEIETNGPTPTSAVGRLRRWITTYKSFPLPVRIGIWIALVGAIGGIVVRVLFSSLEYFQTKSALADLRSPPKEIRFILDLGPDDASGPGHDVWEGINQALEPGPLPFGIITAQAKNDHGKTALALQFAKEAARDDNVVAVVGHLESTTTAAALDVYHQNNLALLMPVPTNPGLTDEIHKYILRMPPTDNEQGEVAAKFMASRKRVKHVAVIRDDGNLTYSNGLADRFKTGMVSIRASRRDGPVITFDETIKDGSLGRVRPDLLRSMDIDAIFFAGTSANAITLLEMFEVAQYQPVILMTDGSITRSLLPTLSKVPDHLFVTFQLEKASPSGNYPTACADSFAENELSFCPFGFDSIILLKQILRNTDGRILSQRQISRADIAGLFAGLRGGPEIKAAFNTYKFDNRGDNTRSQFAVWHAGKDVKWLLYPWQTDNGID